MAYTPQTWSDYPTTSTPINAAALTHIEAGVEDADTRITAHEADTAGVHGIVDTATLATDTDVAAAVTAHEAATDPHPGYLTTAEGAAAYQPVDADLTAFAGLAPADGDVVQRKAGAWVARTPEQLAADLSLGALGDVDTTGAQVGQVVAVTDDSPLAFGLGASPAASLFGRKVAWGGDSITNGSSAGSTTLTFPAQATRIAGSARLASWLTAGVPGERSDQLLARMPTILATAPDHVHVQIGTNDASQSILLATFQANIVSIVAAARAAGVSVSIGTVPPRGASASTATHKLICQYNFWLTTWSAKQGIPLARTYAALVDPATGLMLAGYDSGDGTHPNAAGHLAMARVIAQVVTNRQLAMPWPVTAAAQPTGMLSNPLMSSTAGWVDQGGTAALGLVTLGTVAASNRLPAGQWLTYRLNNSGGASQVNRQVGATLDSTKYAAGDVLVLCSYLYHPSAVVGAKLQVTNDAVAFSIPLFTSGSDPNPGPVMAPFTVPATPGVLRVGVVLTADAGTDLIAYLGATQVYNLTQMGLANVI